MSEEKYQVDEAGNQVLDDEGNPVLVEEEGEKETGEDKGKTEIDGVLYTQDDEGNYLRDGIVVLDSDKIPIYNRLRESGRKITEGEERLTALERKHQAEIDRLKTPPAPEIADDDIDEATGFTGRQLRAQKKMFADEYQVREEGRLYEKATSNINQEKILLANDPDYKDFLANPKFVEEMNAGLMRLSLNTAALPGIVANQIKMIRGAHYRELQNAALKEGEQRGRKFAGESREIIGEIELGKSAGPSQIGGVKITNAMRKEAADKGITIKSLVEIQEFEKKLKKEKEEK